MKFVDCEDQGGYDLTDPCQQTCKEPADASDEKSCEDICVNEMHNMDFSNKNAKYTFYTSCMNVCEN